MSGLAPTPVVPEAEQGFELARVRADFPILARQVYGKPLVYLDNAATTQKPTQVIDRVRRYYEQDNSNIHRGLHHLSEQATLEYELGRDRVRDWLGAAASREIVFVRGTTEAINLVAQSFAGPRLGPGSEVLVTELEHHSNIVPWQLVCERSGATLRYLPIDTRGELCLDELDTLLNENTVIAAVGHISNALGTINPVHTIIKRARAVGARVLIDGAQAMPHIPVNVQELDCDFYAFSSHKMFGPTGLGVLYGREELLEAMPPYQGGGDMIRTVRMSGSTWNELPWKFEAGTPHIAGVIGLATALDYLSGIGMAAIHQHEQALLEYASEKVQSVPGLRVIGTARKKAAILSFTLEGVHPHDIGTIVDREGVAIRTGHHCAMPVMEKFGIPATARASFAFYNSQDEVDLLILALEKCRQVFD